MEREEWSSSMTGERFVRWHVNTEVIGGKLVIEPLVITVDNNDNWDVMLEGKECSARIDHTGTFVHFVDIIATDEQVIGLNALKQGCYICGKESYLTIIGTNSVVTLCRDCYVSVLGIESNDTWNDKLIRIVKEGRDEDK